MAARGMVGGGYRLRWRSAAVKTGTNGAEAVGGDAGGAALAAARQAALVEAAMDEAVEKKAMARGRAAFLGNKLGGAKAGMSGRAFPDVPNC